MHLATLQADSKRPGPMLSQIELEDFFDTEISDGIQSSVKPWVNLRRVQTNSQSEDKLQQTLSKYFSGVLNATEHDLQIPKRQRNHQKGIKYNGKSEKTLYRMDKSARDERMKHSGGITTFFQKAAVPESNQVTKPEPTQNSLDDKLVEEEDVADILSALSGSEINPLLCHLHTCHWYVYSGNLVADGTAKVWKTTVMNSFKTTFHAVLLGEIQNTNLWVNRLHHSGHRFLSPTIGTVPQQQDGNSCGAYAVESGLLFLQGLQDWPPAFKPTSGEVDLQQYQLQLAASIINSSAGDGPVRPFCHSPAFQPSISKPQTQAPVSTPVSPSSSTPANQKEFDVQLNEPPPVSPHTLVVPSHLGHASVTAQDSAQPTNMLPSQLCKPGMQSDLPTSQLQGMDMSGEESCTHETTKFSKGEKAI
ncbi:hypothetical protein HDU77_010002 [Chytriomyces hyalinus]|nr:hypothetical protein HDU77_010002 [Chytriomyces hyalinus]